MQKMQQSLMLNANLLFNEEAAAIPLQVRQTGQQEQQPGQPDQEEMMENNPLL